MALKQEIIGWGGLAEFVALCNDLGMSIEYHDLDREARLVEVSFGFTYPVRNFRELTDFQQFATGFIAGYNTRKNRAP